MEKSKSNQTVRRILWAGGLLLAVLLAGYYFLNVRTSRRSATFVSQTATVSTVTVVKTVQASGSLNAYQSASLNWQTNGIVGKIHVKAGDHVRKGDVLAVLDGSSIPQSVISAQADLIPAQQALEDLQQSDTARAQALVDLNTATDSYNSALNARRNLNGKIQLTKYEYVWIRGRQMVRTTYYKGYADEVMIANADNNVALAKAKLDDARTAYDRIKDGASQASLASAQARVDAAQAAFNTGRIIAPFDGDILIVYNKPNDLVSTSTTAIITANRQTYVVDAKVDETDITKLSAGQTADVTLDAIPGLKLNGKVDSVSLFGANVSGVVKYDVFISIPSSDVQLPLGATANLTIHVGAPVQSLAVPITAVYSDDQGDYVLLAGGGNAPQRVNVQSGDIVGSLVAISGDLKEGDKVLLSQNNATTGSGNSSGGPRGGFFGP